MLQEKIKEAMVTAWKAGNKTAKDVLSLLLGKIKNKAIDLKVDTLPDADVLAIIQKFDKELCEERDAFDKAGHGEKVEELSYQLAVIDEFLSQMLTEDEIKEKINLLEDKSMKSIMGYFKTNYPGQVDMSVVSKIARSL